MTKLPLELACAFGNARGMHREIATIMSVSYRPFTSGIRRGFVVELFEARRVFEEFKELHWPAGNTGPGRRQCDRHRELKRRFEAGVLSPRTAGDAVEGLADKREAEDAPAPTNPGPCYRATPELCSRVIASLDGVVDAHQALFRDGVIRSHRIVGDLGEWIAAQVLSMDLCRSLTQRGWDLEAPGRTVQVKTNARGRKAVRTVLKINEIDFDELAIVVLSRRFRLRTMYVVPRADIDRLAPFKNGRRNLQWSQLDAYALRSVPPALAPLLHDGSPLTVDKGPG